MDGNFYFDNTRFEGNFAQSQGGSLSAVNPIEFKMINSAILVSSNFFYWFT